MMDRSAVVLVDSFNTFEQDLATLEFNGKALISHIADLLSPLLDDIFVVVKTKEQAETYAELLEPSIKCIIDVNECRGPLENALPGFEASNSKHTLLVSYNMPLLSPTVVDLLFDLCHGKTAVVPRWPNQQIEPLHSVYHSKSALKAGQMALEDGLFSLDAMIANLGGVRYISTLAIQEFDAELKSFFKVNTPLDLKMAQTLSKEKPWKTRMKRRL